MGTSIPRVENGRLIILVPEVLVSNMDFIKKTYQLAALERFQVIYLVLLEDTANELAAARSIATLTALVNGGPVCADSRVVDKTAWLAALGEMYRPGDVIVCHAEQEVRVGFLRMLPASEFIRDHFGVPVRILSGFYHPARQQIGQWLRTITYWAGQLAIISAFFFFVIHLEQGMHGFARTLLLIMLLFAAIVAGSVWSRISS